MPLDEPRNTLIIKQRNDIMAVATKPKTKAAAKPAAKVVETPVPASDEVEIFGVSDIAKIIETETGKAIKTRDLRTLLRKMARDGRLEREIVAGNRDRWVWSGPEDAEVEAILEAYRNGELEKDKQEKLQALKDRKAAQRAEKQAAAAAAAPAEDEVADDDEVLDEE